MTGSTTSQACCGAATPLGSGGLLANPFPRPFRLSRDAQTTWQILLRLLSWVTLQLFIFSKVCLLRNHSLKNPDVTDKPFRALLLGMVCKPRQQHLGGFGNAESQAPLNLLNQNLHFGRMPKGYICSLQFGKPWSGAEVNKLFL